MDLFRLALLVSLGMLLGVTGALHAEDAAKDEAAEIAKQVESYPLKTCVVSGEKLGGEMGKPVDVLHEGRLVRFCCKGCIKKFNAEPEKFLKVIDEAAAKAKAEEGAKGAVPENQGDAMGAKLPSDKQDAGGCGGCGGGGCGR